MQQVVIAKPYQFVPPHHGTFWPWLLQKWLPRHTRRSWGVERPEFHGLERLRASLQAGHGVILAPNHCRPCDPYLLMLLGAELRQPFYTMASAHLFMQGRLQRWLLRRAGSLQRLSGRSGSRSPEDRFPNPGRGAPASRGFPRGGDHAGNDRLGYVMDGVAFIARSAAKSRAKANPAGQVVIHPIALRYTFGGDLRRAIAPILDMIEKRLGWMPHFGTSLVERVRRLGEALLTVKEVEYFGVAQAGLRAERLPRLIDRVLGPLEDRYLSGQREVTTVARIKKLRVVITALTEGTCTAEEQATRWRHLGDCSFAQALDSYPRGYLDGEPTAERLLETVERFEEDTTDAARIHRPLQCRIDIDDALPVTTDRTRGEADPLTAQLEDRLKTMLAASAHVCHPWKDIDP